MSLIIHEDFWVTSLRVSGVAVIAGGLPALVGDHKVLDLAQMGTGVAAALPGLGPVLCGSTLILLAGGYARRLRREDEGRGYPGSINGYLLLWVWSLISALTVVTALFLRPL